MIRSTFGRGEAIDVFLSYAPDDEDLRVELEQHLSGMIRSDAIRLWHAGKIVPGEDAKRWTSERLAAARLILLLASASYLASDHLYMEMERALDRARRGEACVIPILLRSFDIEQAPFAQLASLPRNGTPATNWPTRDDAWADIARGLRKAVARLVEPPERAHRTAPFPGLEFFNEARAGYFHGRDAEIAETSALLGDTARGHRRWLQIDGSSGAGKSSLARAGLVPAVRRGRLTGAPKAWRVAVLRPGSDPVENLAHRVHGSLADVLPGATTLDAVASEFRASNTALGSFLRQHTPEGHGYLLVIDQFEEAFTLTGGNRASLRQFDALLAAAISDKGGPLYLVTTIRSDFVGGYRKSKRGPSVAPASSETLPEW
jgi:hypothetical protein